MASDCPKLWAVWLFGKRIKLRLNWFHSWVSVVFTHEWTRVDLSILVPVACQQTHSPQSQQSVTDQ